MNHIHPVMAQALAPFAPPPQSADMDAYLAALRRFDWHHEFSDEHAKVIAGQAALKELWAMQLRVDPDGSIWRRMAPSGHGIPSPVVHHRTTTTTEKN